MTTVSGSSQTLVQFTPAGATAASTPMINNAHLNARILATVTSLDVGVNRHPASGRGRPFFFRSARSCSIWSSFSSELN